MSKEIEFTKQFIENLITFYGLNISAEAKIEDDIIIVDVPSTNANGFLIGRNGENLRSMQNILNAALRAQDFEVNRARLDIAEYRQQQTERLQEQAKQWIDAVLTTGQDLNLHPMNAADRRTVHQLATDTPGVTSDSEGRGRDRHVVLRAE